MTDELPEAVRRVQQVLVDSGSLAKVCLLPRTTATAQDAANALGVPVDRIGKSIVFGTEAGVAVAVVCGDQRVDPILLAGSLGSNKAEPLRADDVKRLTGYVIGGVSPLGLPSSVEVVVDTELRALGWCYVAAGHPKAVVKVDLEELLTTTNARVASIGTRR